MYCLLKDEMLKTGRKYNFMTVPKAVRELQKIEMVRLSEDDNQLEAADEGNGDEGYSEDEYDFLCCGADTEGRGGYPECKGM